MAVTSLCASRREFGDRCCASFVQRSSMGVAARLCSARSPVNDPQTRSARPTPLCRIDPERAFGNPFGHFEVADVDVDT